MPERNDLYIVPTVEQYAQMSQHDRDTAAQLRKINDRLRLAKIKTAEAALRAEESARARTIYNARQEARREANEEVAMIFHDEYARERVRAFEAFPTRPKTYGDIDACAAESHAWDLRNRGVNP